MVKFMILGVGAMILLGCTQTVTALGGKKGKEDDLPEMPKGKEAVDLARAGFAQAAGDIGLMADLMKDLEDPEVMKEVEKLMNDKEFKKEMDALMKSEEWKKGLEGAHKILSDPEAVAAMQNQAKQYMEFLGAGPGKDGTRDFQIEILDCLVMGDDHRDRACFSGREKDCALDEGGENNEDKGDQGENVARKRVRDVGHNAAIDAAGRAAMDPNFMRDTLEMMKDPEIYKQVQETMRNPEFQLQMKQMMDSPEFKRQMEEAGANVESLLKTMKATA